jgi:acetyl esterase/lipase
MVVGLGSASGAAMAAFLSALRHWASRPVTAPAHLMTSSELLATPSQAPDFRIAYGDAESQYGELRIPAGSGPHPVVVLLHGGCWRQEFASAPSMGAMADALRAEGVATWNIEYRRLPEPGSGWPGTYLDVAHAIDHLRVLAPRHELDLSRTVIVGHSAGAHLAHWAAARSQLPQSSPLYAADPLPLNGVINLAGRINMADDISSYERICGGAVVQGMLGGLPDAVPQRYLDASPSSFLPLGLRQVLIWGEHEDYVPTPRAREYAEAAARAGDTVSLVIVPGIGHFETGSPYTSAWPAVRAAVISLLKPVRQPT